MLRGKGREAAFASGVHALHLPVPVPRAAAPPACKHACKQQSLGRHLLIVTVFHGFKQEKRLHPIAINFPIHIQR